MNWAVEFRRPTARTRPLRSEHLAWARGCTRPFRHVASIARRAHPGPRAGPRPFHARARRLVRRIHSSKARCGSSSPVWDPPCQHRVPQNDAPLRLASLQSSDRQWLADKLFRPFTGLDRDGVAVSTRLPTSTSACESPLTSSVEGKDFRKT